MSEIEKKNEEKREKDEEVVFNTYNERGHRNFPAAILSVISVFVLCCVPFMIRYKPICYIEMEEGKLMLATLISMVVFYFLGFDMLAFCVTIVNIALLVMNTYDMFLYSRGDLLGGFYWILILSVLIVVFHFLYPYIMKKADEKKKIDE